MTVLTTPREDAGPCVDAEERHIPGETGVWVFILGEMVAFAIFFGYFMAARGQHSALFEDSSSHLVVGFGVVNTLLLLTSSWLVAAAVRAVRAGARGLAARLMPLSMLCGVGFVISKAFEWGDKVSQNITPDSNLFYTYYFVLTGIHLMHVLLGLAVLTVLWRVCRRSAPKANDLLVLEVGASFWHMVDLLWIVLFPLLYLVR